MLTKVAAVLGGALVVFAILAMLSGSDPETPEEAAELAAEFPTPTPTAEPTPEPTATPEPTPTPESITLSFSGDLLSHGGVTEQARLNGESTELDYDYRPMFAAVAPILETADLAVCHQETPFSADNTALSGYPIFNAPGQLADAVAASGWDACSVASNHALDRGFSGVTQTLDEFDRVNVGHSGTARTADEQANPPIYDVGGVKVAHLSYTYGTNGLPLPPEAPFAVNITTVDDVLEQAAAVRAAGADFVVLSVQWGNEYQQQPTVTQIEQATAWLGSPDLDLIIGDHVHVPQPADVINDKVVLYGLGNFVSNQSPESCGSCPAATQDGMIFTVTVEETTPDVYETTGVHVTPTYVDRTIYEVIPVAQRLADPAVSPAMADNLLASWERTNEAIYALGIDPTFITIEPLPS